MKQRVKCKICGKVGDLSYLKALLRHLRVCHKVQLPNKKLSLDDFYKFIEDYYEETVSDAPIKRKMKDIGYKVSENEIKQIYTRIIYTPMGNKR